MLFDEKKFMEAVKQVPEEKSRPQEEEQKIVGEILRLCSRYDNSTPFVEKSGATLKVFIEAAYHETLRENAPRLFFDMKESSLFSNVRRIPKTRYGIAADINNAESPYKKVKIYMEKDY